MGPQSPSIDRPRILSNSIICFSSISFPRNSSDSAKTAMDPQQQRAGAPQPRPQAQVSGDCSAILTVLLSFVAIFTTIMIMSSPTIKNSLSILHQIPEGHVGVYWRGGALLKTLTNPGFNLKMPLVTQYESVQVTLQTDQVRDIPCGTKEGVMINFEKIKVVNQLRKEYVYETLLNYGVHYDSAWIYDKIHHEINQFCSSHSLQQVYIDVFDQIGEKMKDALQVDCMRYAPGIEIISVRVTKPTIPDSVRRHFEQMEEERIKVLIAIERQKVVEIEAETNKKLAIIEAEKNATVNKILMEQKLMEKESSRTQQEIDNQMYIVRKNSQVDADFYRAIKEAEANKLKLAPQFLLLKFIDSGAPQFLLLKFIDSGAPQFVLRKFTKAVADYITNNREGTNMVLDQRLLWELVRVANGWVLSKRLCFFIFEPHVCLIYLLIYFSE